MQKLWIVFSLFLCLIATIIIRIFYLQIIKGEEFKTDARKQHYFELTLPSDRGILKTSDDFNLVMNQPSYLVYAQPNLIKNKSDFTRKISGILGTDYLSLENQIGNSSKFWIPIANNVDSLTHEKLMQLELAGLGFEKQSTRFYPEASMAAHLLGFVGSDEQGNKKGYFGLEGYYNQDLSGKDGFLIQEKDVHGNPIFLSDIRRLEPQDGRSLILWIDRTVQYIVENKLKNGITKYGASEGQVLVMDPHNGAVLAMAAYPGYDPQNFKLYDPQLYKNPAVASSFEPGSIFKVLVMSAGVDQKLVTSDTKINESGPVVIGPYSIRTWNNQYHGLIDMTDVLVHSSNVGMVYVGRKLGPDKLISYLDKFGFGQLSGIDLQEESTSVVRPREEWKEIDVATVSFGQGIAVTPIQMIRAASAIANGGNLITPMVVKAIQAHNGEIYNIKPPQPSPVISSSTSEVITEMMVAAVDRGESKWTKAKGYRVAGKTGTAQIPVAGHYDAQKTIASFIGFAPADNPKFIILVTLREPTSSPWGSETAAPLFFSIASDLFSYYGILPDGVN